MGQVRAEWRAELGAMVKLAVPVVLSELGWMVMGVVDTIMVGRLGPSAIGAVALANAVYYTPAISGIGLMLGLDTLVSQAYGREDHEECHRWLAQGVYLAIIAAIPIMLGLAVAAQWLAADGDCGGGGAARERLSAAAELGHAAAAALWRVAALLAGRGPGARDYRDPMWRRTW